jgi:curved DNA-binding protein CbpA
LENPYHILGVTPNASTEEIKKAYRVLAMRHHPDRSTHADAEARFNAIKTAYELLADAKRRAEYNQTLNNRIILDSEHEARALWHALFARCDIVMPHDA